jgi:tRNA (cmo5U34)-methyltransferase
MNYPNSWTFKDKKVVSEFDTHVREQLPWYDLVADNVLTSVARHYIPQNGLVYDIGCATGHVSQKLAPILQERDANIIGIDESGAMIEGYNGFGDAVCGDAVAYNYLKFDFAVSFLSMIFLTPKDRTSLLNKLLANLNDGGSIFLVERFLPEGGYNGLISARMTLQAKLLAGCEPNDIIAKELSLRGIQRPMNRSEINGYEIFRFGDFSGYILNKS